MRITPTIGGIYITHNDYQWVYIGNLTWRCLVDKGTSNHPYNIGKIDEYHINNWKLFKIISFNTYLRRL